MSMPAVADWLHNVPSGTTMATPRCAACAAPAGHVGEHDHAGTWHELIDIVDRDTAEPGWYDRAFPYNTDPEEVVLFPYRDLLLCERCRRVRRREALRR